MTISTVSAAAQAATASGTNSSNQLTSLGSDFNSFLTLLTTQLKNQDPSSPVDANQFTQQLVEFAGVQQQVQGNTTLQQILSTLQGNQVSSAASYVGTTIQATGNQGALENGKASFGYTLGTGGGAANVTITDSSGQVVFQGTGTNTKGQNFVSWDGTNSLNGSTEPDGVYTISVKATDANGNADTATPFITGTVDSASISNGVVELGIGSLQVPATNVTTITNLASNGTGSTGAPAPTPAPAAAS